MYVYSESIITNPTIFQSVRFKVALAVKMMLATVAWPSRRICFQFTGLGLRWSTCRHLGSIQAQEAYNYAHRSCCKYILCKGKPDSV